jgi:hypothetical protein
VKDTITWQPLPAGDPDYEALEEKKQEAKTSAEEDGEGELARDVQAELAWNIKQSRDVPWRNVPDFSDRITYSGDYLRRVARDELELGESQD